MQKRKIRAIEKELPPVIIGTTNPILGDPPHFFAPQPDRTEIFYLLDELWEMGLNMYDCAAHYGEPGIGEYLASRNRRHFTVFTDPDQTE